MPGTGQKVCGGWWWWVVVCKPILVLSLDLDQAEQKPLYRSSHWEKHERSERKNDKTLNWWKNPKSKMEYNSLEDNSMQ